MHHPALPRETAAPGLLEVSAALERRFTSKATVPSYSYLGCFQDSIEDDRILAGTYQTIIRETPAYCCEWCAHMNSKFHYCGLEYGDRCYCGSAIAETASNMPPESCSWPCNGDKNLQCGGYRVMDLYSLTESKPSIKYTGTELTTVSVSGYSYLGCYSDFVDRVLNGASMTPSLLDPQFCCDWCAHQEGGFEVCGVEFADQCYCGTATASGALTASASDCNHSCAGAGNTACGGYFRANIYSSIGQSAATTTGNDHSTSTARATLSSSTASSSSAALSSSKTTINGHSTGTARAALSSSTASSSSAALSSSTASSSSAALSSSKTTINGHSTGTAPTTQSSSSTNSPSSSQSSGLSEGLIAGIILGAVAAIFLASLSFFFHRKIGRTTGGSDNPTEGGGVSGREAIGESGNPVEADGIPKSNPPEIAELPGQYYRQTYQQGQHQDRVYQPPPSEMQ